MRDFDFLEPASLTEAVRMLSELGDDCRIFASGSALLLGMRQRMLSPTSVISLGRLGEMRRIDFDPRQGLRIGAMARHAEIAQSPLVRTHYPVLASMASRLANPQVRNQGTLGGNLCYADPSTDPPGCLLALGAHAIIQGPDGERTVPFHEFLVDYFTTALEPNEILVAISIPPLAPNAIGLYTRHLRTAAEHRPLANATFIAQRQGVECTHATLVIGASTVVPTRLARVEDLLLGKRITLDLAEAAGEIAAQDMEAISDARGCADLRRTVMRAVVKRTIAQAFSLSWS